MSLVKFCQNTEARSNTNCINSPPESSGRGKSSQLDSQGQWYSDSKDVTRKENYRLLSLISIDGNILGEILTVWF